MWWVALLVGHVPQQGSDCDYKCCHASHDHEISQVTYHRGTAGVEVDLDHIDVDGGELIHFSLVFKEEYDPSTYDIFVGCGGCASEKPDNYDPLFAEPYPKPDHYQTGVLEPFTTTAYYNLFAQDQLFDSSELWNCSAVSKHFTIRLIAYDNSSEPLLWGAVLGCSQMKCEQFELYERIQFPLYILRNHANWNDAGWTIFLHAVLMLLLLAFVLWWWHGGLLAFCVPVADAPTRQLAEMQGERDWAKLRMVIWQPSIRLLFYGLAVWGALVDIAENTHHLVIASDDAPFRWNGYGAWFIFLALRILFLLLACAPWSAARENSDVATRRWYNQFMATRNYRKMINTFAPYEGLHLYSPFWSVNAWALADALVAFGGLFLGFGFYVYPGALFIAAILRFGEFVTPLGQLEPNGELRRRWLYSAERAPDDQNKTQIPLLAMSK